ncbi:MAG: hypothetical protein RIA10_11970, partial [Amphiplicatus sp.]
MGIVVRIVVFLVGLLGLSLTGLNGAQDFGVDTNSLLTNLGPAEGAATSAQDIWGGPVSRDIRPSLKCRLTSETH